MAAAVFAVDPAGLVGVAVRGGRAEFGDQFVADQMNLAQIGLGTIYGGAGAMPDGHAQIGVAGDTPANS